MDPDTEEPLHPPALVEKNRNLQGLFLQKLQDGLLAFFGGDAVEDETLGLVLVV
jgi:hypothetical protein